MADKIVVTEQMMREALQGNGFSFSSRQTRQVADALTKQLNPPAWHHDGDGVISYGSGGIRLLVRSEFGSRAVERRERVAELICGVLNERGVQVDSA